MMQSRKNVVLAVVEQKVKANSGGKRVYTVSNFKKYVLDAGETGQDTYWKARSNNIILSNSVKIRSLLYKNQKWVYFDNRLYEVENLGKTNNEAFIYLNVKESEDKDVKKAIEDFITALGGVEWQMR